jgi:zeaxanthin glucosyltransferase
MRVLFMVVPNTRGDINPYIALTRQLVAEGHDVAWLSLPEGLGDFAPLATAAGATVLPTPPRDPPPWPRGRELAGLLSDPLAFIQLQQRIVDEVPARIEGVRTLLRDTRPDIVASDHAYELIPMMIASELEGVTHAVVSLTLVLLAQARLAISASLTDAVQGEYSRFWTSMRSLFRRYRVGALMMPGQILSRALNVVFTTEAFVGSVGSGTTRDPSVTAAPVLVGPCIDPAPAATDFPWHRLRNDGRIVYVSFGSVFGDERLLEVIAEAAAPLDLQVVFGGNLAGAQLVDHLPGDTLAVRYAPQRELLGKVRAFVTHGGLNSVNESLFHGTPMLVVPLALDQPIQGYFVRQCGAGIVMDREHATRDVEACRTALAALIEPASTYRDAALRVKSSYRANDGVKGTCDRLLELARRPRTSPR